MLPPILYLLLLSLPEVLSNCHDHRYGVPSKSCKRIKDEKFQVRGGGINVVPMWEYMLLKEPPSDKRVKRAAARGFNATSLPVLKPGTVAGVTINKSAPREPPRNPINLPVHRYSQSAIKTHDASIPPQRHQTLIQPVDSNAPPPSDPRHLTQRQVQPSEWRPTLFSTNIAHQQNSLNEVNRKKFKRQESYPTATRKPEYQEAGGEGGQIQEPPKDHEEPYRNGKKSRKHKNKSKNKKKGRKNKKHRKMCKMCKELSSEENSEEKEVACEICEKTSSKFEGQKEEVATNDKERGLLQSALKVQPIHKKGKGRKEEDNDEDEDEDEEEFPSEGGGGGNVQPPRGGAAEDNDDNDDGDDDNNDNDDDYEVGGDETTTVTTTTKKPTTISIPTILDYVERAKQNRLMRIPVYRGKQIGGTNDTATNGTMDGASQKAIEEMSEFSSNIRESNKTSKFADKPNVKYSYPPKDTLPLQTCFHNPSGYVCCNLELNNVVESTYKEIKELPNFNPCNLQLIANKLQRASEKMFGHPFESIVSHADFAQNINFAGDMVCKLEIDGKYLLAYGTPYHADDAVGPQGPDGRPLPVRSLKV